MKKLLGSIVGVIAVIALSVSCNSPLTPRPTTVVFTAQLSPANEVPPVTNADASASGTVTITIHDITYGDGSSATAGVADFQVSVSNFPLATNLTAAHIHTGTIGVAGAVVLDTGLSASGGMFLATGSGSFSRTGIAVTGDLINQFTANPASFYFNVHTSLNGTGAIRGQLVKQ
jgi:hypothetical protein